jgi:hypothetical protein
VFGQKPQGDVGRIVHPNCAWHGSRLRSTLQPPTTTTTQRHRLRRNIPPNNTTRHQKGSDTILAQHDQRHCPYRGSDAILARRDQRHYPTTLTPTPTNDTTTSYLQLPLQLHQVHYNYSNLDLNPGRLLSHRITTTTSPSPLQPHQS